MQLKAVLFDHDGTLVDSEGVHWQLWQEVLKQYAIELPESEYKARFAGVPTPVNAIELVARHALDISPAALSQQKIEATRMYLSRQAYPLMPHALETIRFFREQGAKLAVVTGAGREAINSTLQAHGLTDSFSVVVTCDDVRNNKPAPDCYLLALERLGIAAAEAVALEDTEHGVHAAVAAGVACCGVKNAFSESHDFSQASGIFSNLAEAAAWISGTYRF